MYYYEIKDNRGKRLGIVAAVVYVAVWVVLFMAVNFKFEARSAGEGILINFGDMDEAAGLAVSDVGLNVASRLSEISGELLTQDFEEAPSVRQRVDDRNDNPSDTHRNIPATQANPPAEQTRRTPNPALSMPAVSPGRSGSEGTAVSGSGNQGSPEGSEAGSHDGTGQEGSGVGFDLAGRSNISLPVPVYNAGDEGTVVVEVVVSADGKVRSARRVSSNRDPNNINKRIVTTTTNDARLVRAAEQAASSSVFNKITRDGEQRGWIIYKFNVK